MKRIGNLWERITTFDNLYRAYRQARRGKGTRPTVTRFELDLEGNLFGLQEGLQTRTYRPGEYHLFNIYDRKPRIIAAAPFADRVVHHALMNLVEPVLDRRFISDCYACRVGKGVHAAVRRYQAWTRRYPYVLKTDVRQYFPSIDHDILKAKLRRRIKDRNVLWLFDTIIDSAPKARSPGRFFPGDDLLVLMERRCGVPIGNLTSQFFGNLYLDDLDHYLKEVCGVRAYLRYVDDLILLGEDKRYLWELKERIEDFLIGERLCLHPDKVQVQPAALGLDVLGYRVFPDRILLRRDNGYRYRRRLWAMQRDFRRGDITIKDVHASVAAWLGHIRHADSLGLCRAVLSPICFTLGNRVVRRPGVWFAAVAGTTNHRTSGRRTETGTRPTKRTTTSVFVSPGRLPQGSEPAHLRMRRAYLRVPMARFPVPRSGTRRPKRRAGNAAPGAGRPSRRPWAFFKAVAAFLLGSIGISFPLAAQDDSAPPPSPAFSTQPCRIQPGAGPELAVIAAGRFLMGSPANEQGRDPDEGPQHGVSVVTPFAIGRCEVTVGEFRAFVEDTDYRTDAERDKGCYAFQDDRSTWEPRRDRDWRNPGFPQTERHPVVCVSWNDARAYAHWLSLRTGHRYRLPSAAEWEYAARGVRATGVPGPTPRRYWGDDPEDKQICAFANGADLDAKERFGDWVTNNCRDGFVFTAPIASFQPNAFGLFDMLGNVWEWTADCWHDTYDNAPVDGGAWKEKNGGDCSRRVVRGGGWGRRPQDLRSANRDGVTTVDAGDALGFRLARAL